MAKAAYSLGVLSTAARRKNQHAMSRLAAEHFLPTEVASQIVRPLRSATIQSPFGTRTPEVVQFQVKTTSLSKLTVLRSTISP
jgi:hypothetical protein